MRHDHRGGLVRERVKQVQSAMPLVQMIITPLMFLSGALFPLSIFRVGWYHHLNPVFPVEPVRSVSSPTSIS